MEPEEFLVDVFLQQPYSVSDISVAVWISLYIYSVVLSLDCSFDFFFF